MRIEVLREFQVYAKWMSFRKAAAELHVTQSCLSKHIAELEKELGLSLIDRDSNKAALTAVGAAFLEETSYVLAAYDAALKRCYDMQREKRRTLKIQELLQNNAMAILYSTTSRYLKEHGDLDVSFSQLQRGDAMSSLNDGTFDVAIDLQFFDEGEDVEQYSEVLADYGLATCALLTEPMVVWHQRDNSKLSNLDRITFDDLRDMPIVTSSGEVHDYYGDAVKTLYERKGMIPRFRKSPMGTSPSSYFLSHFRDGIFFASPAMIDDVRLKCRDDLRYVILDEPCFQITTLLVAKRSNEIALDFLSFVQRTVETD